MQPTEHLEIQRGDDHTVAAGAPIEFIDPGTWPDITGATLILTVRDKTTDAIQLAKAGSVVAGPPRKARFEPTRTETATMLAGYRRHNFDVQATLAAGAGVRTLAAGDCTVWPDQSR